MTENEYELLTETLQNMVEKPVPLKLDITLTTAVARLRDIPGCKTIQAKYSWFDNRAGEFVWSIWIAEYSRWFESPSLACVVETILTFPTGEKLFPSQVDTILETANEPTASF